MRRIAVLVLMIVACRKEAPPAAPNASQTATTTAAAGPGDLRNSNMDVVIPLLRDAVAKCAPEKTEFAANEPVKLTLQLNESPEQLRVGARLVDENGEEAAYANVPANGQKAVTVTIAKPPQAGTYTLEGYWGGNRVCSETVKIGG
ncbi:MAG TPA: copper resistance protein CopC [Thermoanaerobaculia bacterium]|jgi:hypothetical protein|nr:copper resistance protein CopC [Thermoanaerobaculia bacterium]